MRKTSIRASLLRSLFALIILLTGALLVTTFTSAESFRESVSRALIDRSLDRVESDLHEFFDPVIDALYLTRRWAASGLIDPWDSASLNPVFMPLMERDPQISAINTANSAGRGAMLMRLGDRWRNRNVDIEAAGDRLDFSERRDRETLLRSWSDESPAEGDRYDPRTRAWYQVIPREALESAGRGEAPDAIYWTSAYEFFTTKEFGITASTAVTGSDGRPFIVAADVLLTDLSDFTRKLDVSPNGMAFLLDDQRRLLGLPGHERFENPRARHRATLALPGEIGIGVLEDGVRAVRALGTSWTGSFSFESGVSSWWAESRDIDLGENRRLQIVVAIPESDLLSVIVRQRQVLAGVSALALLVAVFIALVLSRRFSAPLARLVGNSQRIGLLDLERPEPLESNLIEVDQLAAEQERMRVALDAFSRYVPIEVVRKLVYRGEAAKIGGSLRTITVLFSDIVGFTTIAEQMTPEAVTRHLADYFGELLAAIRADGHGEVSQIVGDGVVALWGAPVEDDDHVVHAVEAVLRCMARLDVKNPAWSERGLPPLPTRFGLSTGPTVVGNVGAPSRMLYTGVGDSMNLASRIEGLNRVYGTRVLVSDTVRAAAGSAFEWREIDRVRVKGKKDAVEIFEVLGRAGRVPDARLARAARYEDALSAYRRRDFEAAAALFEPLASGPEGDVAARRLLESCRGLMRQPPGEDWQATTRFSEK